MATTIRWRVFCVVGLCCVAFGCGDDSASKHAPDGGSDAPDLSDANSSDTADRDTESADIADEDGASVDAGNTGDDAGPGGCGALPEILIAGTAQTEGLAQNAAQCGQPEFSWITDTSVGAPGEGLGEVTGFGLQKDFTIEALESAVELLGASTPRPIAHDVHLTQYEYTTQDRGGLVNASALVAFPKGHQAGDEPKDIILLLHGTSGFTDACAATDELEYQALAALIASFGFVVVAPDYIGLNAVSETGFLHPYLVGQAAAISSIDAVRGAMRLGAEERGDWCLRPRMMTVGGSQGGHAALWIDRLAPYYAREFELAGTVATVPPADALGQMANALNNLVNATGNTAAFFGASAGWYGYQDRLDEVFVSPLDEDVPAALGAGCSFDDVVPNPTTPADFFQQPLLEAAENDTLADFAPWGCMAAENGLTSTSVERLGPNSDSYGILFVLGEDDELVNPAIERNSFDTLCSRGMPMEYLECAGSKHGETTLLALPEILDFVEARFAGESFDGPGVCERSAPVACRGGDLQD